MFLPLPKPALLQMQGRARRAADPDLQGSDAKVV
jgi:hypothetical protein